MQKTRILVSAAADELKRDVSEIESFVRRLNDCYLDRGRYFALLLDEDISGLTAGLSGASLPGDSQSGQAAAMELLSECDLAFFLLGKGEAFENAGAYSYASDSYKKSGKPEIFVYVKSELQEFDAQTSQPADATSSNSAAAHASDPGAAPDSAAAHVSDPAAAHAPDPGAAPDPAAAHASDPDSASDPAAAHASGPGVTRSLTVGGAPLITTHNYSHIDTLKLGILMQIKQLELDGIDIRLEGGKAWQGNTALMPLDNVESVSGYENLQKLKQDRAELESRYIEARARYAQNPDDAAAYEDFAEASKRRSKAIEDIRDVEAQLYNMVEGMYVQTSGGKLSQRQAEAYRLAERGLLSEARDVLDFYAIVSESRHDDEAAEQIAARVQVHVNEQLQLKDINAALLDWEGVDECYREAMRLEEKHNLPRNAALSYMEHLYFKRRYSEAMTLGEAMNRHYRSPESREPGEDKSLLYNLLGIVCYSCSRMAEAEEMLKESLRIRSTRKDGDPDIIGRDIASVYNSLGNFYYLQKRYDEAVEAHESALEIRKKLAARNADAYEEFLAYSYVNLGAVYDDMEKSGESAEITSLAIDIFKRLSVVKPDPHMGFLSAGYVNLGAAYVNLQRYDEAEQQFETALQIQLRLTAENPDTFGFRLGETYVEYGRLLQKAGRFADAQEKYMTAVDLYKKMAVYDPDAHEPSLAGCYSRLAELYSEMKLFQEAESSLASAIVLYDKYAGSNPAHATSASDARTLLANLNAKQLDAGGVKSGLTPKEQEIAMLLTDGVSKGEITRKQRISPADLERAIRAIREKVVGMADTDLVVDAVIRDFKLTGREADMLRCLRKNLGNDAIAAELILSDETVRKHVRRLMKKLPVERRQDVSAWLDGYSAGNS